MRKSESKRTKEQFPASVKNKTGYTDWTQEPASDKQIEYIKVIQEAAKKIHHYLPFIDYRTATKLQASDYIEHYRSVAFGEH